jgi:hypothetical protein
MTPASASAPSTARLVFRALVFSLAGLVLVVMGVGQLLAKDWRVATERTLPADPARVGALLRDLRTWERWCRLDIQLGPLTTREVLGDPGQPGQRIVWSGARGRAVLEVAAIGEQSLEYTVAFEVADGGPPGRGRFAWRAEGTGCRLSWSDEGSYANVILRWFGWFGALQERVRQIHDATFVALQRELETGGG